MPAAILVACLGWSTGAAAGPPDEAGPKPRADADADADADATMAATHEPGATPSASAPIAETTHDEMRDDAPPAPAPVTAVATAPADDPWTPWIGRPVRLRITGPSGERIVEGRLVANAPETLAIALEPSGQVAAVAKAQIVGVDALPLFPEAAAPETGREKRGLGLMIGGGVMSSSGVVISAAGITGAARSGDNLAAIALVPGLGLLAGGIAMIVVGKKRHDAHREAFGWARVMPVLHLDETRAHAGMVVQF